MSIRFEPLALDPAAAYGGVVGSMHEQVEKLSLALTGEEESRCAQHTAANMRADLEGGQAIYDAFHGWVVTGDYGRLWSVVQTESDPENAAGLAEAVRALGSGAQLCRTLAENAVLTARKFSWDEHAAELRGLMAQAAAKKKAAGR